jgi:hypothetical protein
MRAIVDLWLGQLWKLTVLWPVWLLTPEGLRAVFAPRMLWRIALMLAFAVALNAMLQAGLPPDMALIGSGDAVAYLDVVAIAWAVGAAGVLKTAAAWVVRRLKPKVQVAARRARRTGMRRRGPKRPSPPANDDGLPGGRWAVAA